MPEYCVTLNRSARKELNNLNTSVLQRIFPKIEALGDDPHPKGSRKIQGHQNLWRIRVGDYRVIYSHDETEKSVNIVAVRHRREAYRF